MRQITIQDVIAMRAACTMEHDEAQRIFQKFYPASVSAKQDEDFSALETLFA